MKTGVGKRALRSSVSPRHLSHIRIGWAKHSQRTLFPDPCMNHPLRLCREAAILLPALLFREPRAGTAVRQYADIFMPVPGGQRFGKWRFKRLPVRAFGRNQQVAYADEGVTTRN